LEHHGRLPLALDLSPDLVAVDRQGSGGAGLLGGVGGGRGQQQGDGQEAGEETDHARVRMVALSVERLGCGFIVAAPTCPLPACGAPPPEGEEGPTRIFCPLRGRTTTRWRVVRWGPAACPQSKRPRSFLRGLRLVQISAC